MEYIIATKNLSKNYGPVKAASDLSLEVKKGEIYGFLGLNGAGKTTTIRMLLGMISPTSGDAYIKGHKINSNNNVVWKNVGYMVETPYSYPNLTVFENLEIIRRLRFLPDKNAVKHIIDLLHLQQYSKVKAKNLSLGNAQRLGLAKALIHRPEILILDEPTNGLDPAGIYEVREMLNDLAINHSVTVFISSHILGEISKFATRLGIIHQGKMIQEVESKQMNELRQRRLLVKTKDMKSAYNTLRENGYNEIKISNEHIEIKDNEAITNPENVATKLVYAGFPLQLLQVNEEDLESFFLRTIQMNGGIR